MTLNIKSILKAKFCKLKFIRLSIAKPFLKSALKYSRNFSFFHSYERSGFHFCTEASISCSPPLIHWVQLMEFTVRALGALAHLLQISSGMGGKIRADAPCEPLSYRFLQTVFSDRILLPREIPEAPRICHSLNRVLLGICFSLS